VNALGTRVVSALVLAPLVLGALYLGGVYTDILMIGTGGRVAFEWARLVVGPMRPPVLTAMLGVGAAVTAFAVGLPMVAFGLLAVTAALASVLVRPPVEAGSRLWLGAGIVYLAAGCMGFLALRDRPEVGVLLVGWLIAVVWATDIGAYAAGRKIGGPRLLVRVSPNKTWSGLAGGVVCAAGVSLLIALWQPELAPAMALPGIGSVILVSIALAVVSQGGDLLESALKRRVGAKDASSLIPGHGGLLDRIDGLVAASVVLTLSMVALDATA
jgi:phosphatidate cytidylyltransferase